MYPVSKLYSPYTSNKFARTMKLKCRLRIEQIKSSILNLNPYPIICWMLFFTSELIPNLTLSFLLFQSLFFQFSYASQNMYMYVEIVFAIDSMSKIYDHHNASCDDCVCHFYTFFLLFLHQWMWLYFSEIYTKLRYWGSKQFNRKNRNAWCVDWLWFISFKRHAVQKCQEIAVKHERNGKPRRTKYFKFQNRWRFI